MGSSIEQIFINCSFVVIYGFYFQNTIGKNVEKKKVKIAIKCVWEPTWLRKA